MDGVEFRDLKKEGGKKELPIYDVCIYMCVYKEREREERETGGEGRGVIS